MPAKNPRMSITISPDMKAVLMRLAAHQGTSGASVVSSLLQDAKPALERVCAALDRAQAAQASFLSGWKDAMSQAEDALSSSYGHIDAFLSSMEEAEGGCEKGGVELRGAVSTGVGAGACAHAETAPEAGKGKGADPRVVTRGLGMEEPQVPSNAVLSKKPSVRRASK